MKTLSPSLFLATLLFCVACPKDPVPEVSCPRYFEANAAGHCVGIVPAAPCPGGTMRVVGERECLPVGPSRCGADFEPEPDGWGCRPILPATPCTGGQREVLGSSTCENVGRCSPTPTSNATHWVDPAFTPDATHFQTISAALAAAPDGSVISVAAGTYTENLVITRAVTVLGDCPTTTILQAPASNPGMGVRFDGVRGAEIGHLSLRGFLPAIGAMGGAEASVITTIIEDSIAYGAIAIDPNTRLTIVRSVIRDTRAGTGEVTGNAVAVNAGGRLELSDSTLSGSVGVAAYVSGTGTLQIDDSVILNTTLDAGLQNDAGVKAHAGGTVWIGSSAIVANSGVGVVAADPGTTLTILDSVISDTLSDDTGLSGFGLAVLAGASGTISGLTSTRNRSMSVVVRRSTATIEGLISRDTLSSDQTWTTMGGDAVRPGVGLWIAKGAEVQVGDSAVIGGFGEALHIDESTASFSRVHLRAASNDLADLRHTVDLAIMLGSQVELDGVEIHSRNHWAAQVSDSGSSLTASRLLVTSMEDRTDPVTGAVAVTQAASATFDGLWIDDYPQIGLLVMAGASVRVNDSVVSGIREGGPNNLYGDGLACMFSSLLHIRGSELSGNAHSGIWMENCGGSLVESRVVDNLLGIRATSGMTVETLAELPSTVGVGTLIIDDATLFEGNEVRLSADTIVLPELPPGGDPPPQ